MSLLVRAHIFDWANKGQRDLQSLQGKSVLTFTLTGSTIKHGVISNLIITIKNIVIPVL